MHHSLFICIILSISSHFIPHGDAFAPVGSNRRSADAVWVSITALQAQQRQKKPQSSSFSQHRQLNSELVQCQDAKELLQKLQDLPGALTRPKGGGELSKVNFSTSLHRLAKHSLKGDRQYILSDPRFALLLAGLAEALVDMDFRTREVSNLGWALAKLNIVPPLSSLPLQDPELVSNNLIISAKNLRQAVYEAASQKQRDARHWIPKLAHLTGVILDRIPYHLQLERKQGDFKLQEYANLLWAFATSGRTNPAVFKRLVHEMMHQQTQELKKGNIELRPQEWSNSMWAFATAKVFDGHEELLAFTAELMEHNPDFVANYKPQEMSNTIWAVATLLANKDAPPTEQEEQHSLTILRHIASMFKDRAHEFKTQELSNSAWALATLGFGLKATTDQSLNNYVVLRSTQPDEDRQLMQEALHALVAASQEKVFKFRSQELNNLSWALARLVDEKDDKINILLHEIGRQFCNPKRVVQSQDIGTTLWAFANLEFFDDEIYRGIVRRITPGHWEKAKPQELSNTLWALATSEMSISDVDAFDTSLLSSEVRPPAVDPVTFAFGTAAKELMRRPEQFKSQEIKDVLWSFSKIGIRHPILFRSVTEHLVGRENGETLACRGLDEFSPQGLGNMAYAFARQAQLAVEASERLKGKSNLSNTSGRLAVYTASYFDIGEVLLQKLFASIATAAIKNHDNLTNLKPQDLSNTMWTFAVLGLRHTAFVEAAKKELSRRVRLYNNGDVNTMTVFKGQELANLLWALATLNVPAGNIFDDLTLYLKKLCCQEQSRVSMKSIAGIFKRQELANIAWSCAVFGVYPPDLMKILYSGLIGSGKSSPSSIAKLYGDRGLQFQSVMSLVYVQTAVDCEGQLEHLGLALPPDFPDAWKDGKSASSDQLTDSSIELNLSPSRIQRSVSSAFGRIGFDHVDEHIITMENMSLDYGIKIPPRVLEILSIDIANVEKQVAVEVDGPAHFISVIDDPVAKAGYSKMINGKLEWQFLWDGSSQIFNGPTALKQRLLQAFGWKTISIPFWEWSSYNSNPELEDDYCRRLLADTIRE